MGFIALIFQDRLSMLVDYHAEQCWQEWSKSVYKQKDYISKLIYTKHTCIYKK